MLEIESVPQVLLLGQYSTGFENDVDLNFKLFFFIQPNFIMKGKTTFIKNMLGRAYPGMHVGPEPTTDHFVSVVHGERCCVVVVWHLFYIF